MAYAFVRYEVKDKVAYITINRPERLNAVHPPATQEILEAWQAVERDPDVYVAIMTGAGDRAFSTGQDLKNAAEQYNRGLPVQASASGGAGGITDPNNAISKPVIAAVNGYAVGAGFEMAMACDIVVAAEHAQFGLPEVLRGQVATAGGIHRFPRHVPVKIAMGLMLTGRLLSAQEALRLGLVNEVVPKEKLMAAADEWAQGILAAAPLSVRGTKQGALEGLDLPLAEAYHRTYSWIEAARNSEDYKEGPRAFAEKRPPRWTGR